MDHGPDEAERARAAVTFACLRWIRHTGPEPVAVAAESPRTVSRRLTDDSPPFPPPPQHPLWDRWLDG